MDALSRMMKGVVTGEARSRAGSSRGESTTGEDSRIAGEGTSRAERVMALWEDEGRDMGEAKDWRLVRTGFLRRP